MLRMVYASADRNSQTAGPGDRMVHILQHLGNAPEYTTEELSRARQGTIALEISARFDRGGQYLCSFSLIAYLPMSLFAYRSGGATTGAS